MATLIEVSNLSIAWRDAFLFVFKHTEVSPLVVSIRDFENQPPEDDTIKTTLSGYLTKFNRSSVSTTASTIFPWTFWNPDVSREEVYSRYESILPRLTRVPANRRGTYFGRLINYGDEGTNQLEKILTTYENKIRRRSAFVASLFDPNLDHTGTPYLGFPCLHQVCFAQVGKGALSVTGFYAMQHLFERGYGNYLGLARLGYFVAHAMGRTLTRCTCVASVGRFASSSRTKQDLRPLASELSA